MKVLVTGGAGFIGSTVCSALADAGHQVVILDDLSTGRSEFVLGRPFYEGDIADEELLDRLFGDHPDIACAVHCAAAIVVPESVADPLHYYDNNVAGTVRFLRYLADHRRTRLLFSSSASIYAPDAGPALDESAPVAPNSPYARSKAMIEQILADSAAAELLTPVSLRYFNPIGADPQLRTGLPLARPTHALGRLIEAWETGGAFQIAGVDWPTRDGTGVRDYVHVWDLARAHVLAVERFDSLVATAKGGHLVVNLGTGTGTTVRELAAAFERVAGTPVPTIDGAPRAGDVPGACACSHRAESLLGWRPRYGIDDGIRHALAWRARWRDRAELAAS